jgi:hypothetical protein
MKTDFNKNHSAGSAVKIYANETSTAGAATAKAKKPGRPERRPE